MRKMSHLIVTSSVTNQKSTGKQASAPKKKPAERVLKQTFTASWMDSYSVIQVTFSSSHLDRHCKTLSDLITSESNHVYPYHLLVLALADQFHRCRLLLVRWHHCIVHGCKFGDVGLDGVGTVLVFCFFLGLNQNFQGCMSGMFESKRDNIRTY